MRLREQQVLMQHFVEKGRVYSASTLVKPSNKSQLVLSLIIIIIIIIIIMNFIKVSCPIAQAQCLTNWGDCIIYIKL